MESGRAISFNASDIASTGDIFASTLTVYLLKGCDLTQATEFVSLAVYRTYEAKTPYREGILLENMLPMLNHETYEASIQAVIF